MPKLKRNQKLLCIPCGREIIVSAAGVSRTTIWCCGRPMQPKGKAAPKKKTAKKKTTKRKKKARRR